MQRDNLGRELTRSKTTMRHAFEAAASGIYQSDKEPLKAHVWASNAGLSKSPVWRISRKGR